MHLKSMIRSPVADFPFPRFAANLQNANVRA